MLRISRTHFEMSLQNLKVYSCNATRFLKLATARHRTLLLLTGLSPDEGQRNVRAPPVFDPSAGRVRDREDSASLMGAQIRG